MSVSAVPSSTSADSSLLSTLGISGNTGDAVTSDLQSFVQAKNAGNASTADAALVQLKSDLASEEAQLVVGLESGGEANTSDAGDGLLSGLLALNSNSNIDSALASIQNLAAQNAQPATTPVTAAGTDDPDTMATTGTQVNVSA